MYKNILAINWGWGQGQWVRGHGISRSIEEMKEHDVEIPGVGELKRKLNF